MIPILTLSEIESKLGYAFSDRYEKTQNSVKMFGILFARPDSKLSKEQIVGSISYFNTLSADKIDFFCAGYGVSDRSGKLQDLNKLELINGALHSFSNTAYLEVVDQLQRQTNLRTTGGTELVLTNARYDHENSAVDIDYSSCIFCDLDQMLADEAIASIERFFKQIVDYADSCDSNDPTWGFSDKKGVHAGGSWLKRLVLSLLPAKLGELYSSAQHFAVRDARPIAT
ncbi:MAG: hypothetical protein AAFU85_24400 [Planctomycetota bacterium]